MTKINWGVRVRNPVFWAQLMLSVIAPLLAYTGLTAQDITSWQTLGGLLVGAARNPYVLTMVAVSVWNAISDPTTAGLSDSARALTYKIPH